MPASLAKRPYHHLAIIFPTEREPVMLTRRNLLHCLRCTLACKPPQARFGGTLAPVCSSSSSAATDLAVRARRARRACCVCPPHPHVRILNTPLPCAQALGAGHDLCNLAREATGQLIPNQTSSKQGRCQLASSTSTTPQINLQMTERAWHLVVGFIHQGAVLVILHMPGPSFLLTSQTVQIATSLTTPPNEAFLRAPPSSNRKTPDMPGDP